MTSGRTIAALNQLATLHGRSLASYLRYASPTWHQGNEKCKASLSLIADQKVEMADRLGEMIVSNGGVVDPGAYPMFYTGYHDLSFEFLLDQLIDEQHQAVPKIEQCLAVLSDDPRANELAQEALGMAKGHLDSLQELKAAPA